MAKDVPVDAKNKDGKKAIDFLKTQDRRTQYLRVAGKQSAVSNAAKKKEGVKVRSVSPAPEREEKMADREDGDQELEEERLRARSHLDKPGFKTKEAMAMLTTLVNDLSDLTPAEAKLAKSSKERWVEMERPQRKDSVADSDAAEDEEKDAALPTASGDAQEEEDEDDEEVEEEEDLPQQAEEADDLDLLTFDNLEWEVECTAEVWKTLRDQLVTFELKQRIVRSIRFLASGEWRPQLCRKVSVGVTVLVICHLLVAVIDWMQE